METSTLDPISQLKEANDWMRRRQKRNAPSVWIRLQCERSGNSPFAFITSGKEMDFDTGIPGQADKIASILFEHSVLNYSIKSVQWYNNMMWIVIGKDNNTNIDEKAMESIIGWFK